MATNIFLSNKLVSLCRGKVAFEEEAPDPIISQPHFGGLP
jgi:hypothetical protein